MIHDRRFLLAMLAVAVIGVAVMPFLWGAEDPQLGLHRQHIITMTQAERVRLERNFERFQELSESEREHFRKLHADLEDDRRNHHGRSNATLETYSLWLQAISPFERETLQKEQDPAKKIGLIREVLDKQREDRIELHLDSRKEERLGPIPILRPKDLEKVLALFNQAAESALPSAAVTRQLKGYEGPQRTLKLLELLGRQDKRLFPLLTDARMRSMMKAVSDEEAREMLETISEGHPAPPAVRKLKMAITLWKNLELAVERESRQRQITDQMLEIVLAELPAEEQEELLGLSPALFRLELRRRALDADSSRPIDRRYVQNLLRKSFDEAASRGNGKYQPGRNRSGPRDLPFRRKNKPSNPN